MWISAISDKSQFFGVEQRAVAGDQPGFFERAHPAQAGRWRQADAVGQILVADAAVLLQHLQNLPVVAIELHDISHIFTVVADILSKIRPITQYLLKI
jgi:hypothetical protein